MEVVSMVPVMTRATIREYSVPSSRVQREPITAWAWKRLGQYECNLGSRCGVGQLAQKIPRELPARRPHGYRTVSRAAPSSSQLMQHPWPCGGTAMGACSVRAVSANRWVRQEDTAPDAQALPCKAPHLCDTGRGEAMSPGCERGGVISGPAASARLCSPCASLCERKRAHYARPPRPVLCGTLRRVRRGEAAWWQGQQPVSMPARGHISGE